MEYLLTDNDYITINNLINEFVNAKKINIKSDKSVSERLSYEIQTGTLFIDINVKFKFIKALKSDKTFIYNILTKIHVYFCQTVSSVMKEVYINVNRLDIDYAEEKERT